MLKGSLKADQQLALISTSTDLKAAVEGAVYLQVSAGLFMSTSQGRSCLLVNCWC